METIGADLAPVNYYEAVQKKGYGKSFLEFLSEVIVNYFEEHGLELKFEDEQA